MTSSGTEGTLVSDLRLESSVAMGETLTMSNRPANAARVDVLNSGPAASHAGSSTARRFATACASPPGSDGVGVDWQSPTNDGTASLINVTAVSTGSGAARGLRVNAQTNADLLIFATNVIAKSLNAGVDVAAMTNGAANTTSEIQFANSNYNSIATTIGAGTITTPGTNGNQIPDPTFVSPGTGNLHQTPGSNTIDAGTVDDLGALDVDRDPRLIDGDCGGVAEPDIGADEFVPTCPVPPGPDPGPAADTAAADTTITDGPSGKTKSKSATFSFTGTDARAVASFECSLDYGSFEPCISPKTYSGSRRASTPSRCARATPPATSTHAGDAVWKVKKKKKKK